MKIVVAFDSFKGCMTAKEACHTAAAAIRDTMPDAQVIECPLSDGGEGLMECVEERLKVKKVKVKVHDPLMNVIDANYLISNNGDVAYMEMAAASGLTLVPTDKRNPMIATTYGVGDMIGHAMSMGCKEIVMGIGGSATCDGGKGMIKAIAESEYIKTLIHISDGDTLWQRLKSQHLLPKITVACDVTNPLFGKNGAAYVFAPQKGATPQQVEILDNDLRAFAQQTESFGLASPELALSPGAGAAGGLGYGLMAYLGAELKSGIDIILNICNFDTMIMDADIIITGEGKSDSQTLMGKVPYGVLRRVKALKSDDSHMPQVHLLSGAIDDPDHILSQHFDSVRSINEGDTRPLSVLTQKDVAMENIIAFTRGNVPFLQSVVAYPTPLWYK